MTATTPIRVMLVDDHAVARAGYRFMLESLPEISVVAEAASGEEAIRLYSAVLPDMVILDLSMPGIGGRETLAQLRAAWPHCRILICTMHETAALIDHVLQAGAAGYISKNSSPEVLVTAVRRIAEGQNYVDPELAQNLLIRNREGNSEGSGKQAIVGLKSLSPREFQILCLFAEAKGIDEIAAELSISSKTVANNLTIIKEKLQVSSVTELVRLAISKGLVSL